MLHPSKSTGCCRKGAKKINEKKLLETNGGRDWLGKLHWSVLVEAIPLTNILAILPIDTSWWPDLAAKMSPIELRPIAFYKITNKLSSPKEVAFNWFKCRVSHALNSAISLLGSLLRFLLVEESESQGEVPVPSRDSRLPERKRKRLLLRLDSTAGFSFPSLPLPPATNFL